MTKTVSISIYIVIISNAILSLLHIATPYTKYLAYTGLFYLFVVEPLIKFLSVKYRNKLKTP